MFLRAFHTCIQIGIYKGMIKESEEEFDPENTTNCSINISHGKCAFMHTLQQRVLKYIMRKS